MIDVATEARRSQRYSFLKRDDLCVLCASVATVP